MQWLNATVLCAEQNRITTSLSVSTRLKILESWSILCWKRHVDLLLNSQNMKHSLKSILLTVWTAERKRPADNLHLQHWSCKVDTIFESLIKYQKFQKCDVKIINQDYLYEWVMGMCTFEPFLPNFKLFCWKNLNRHFFCCVCGVQSFYIPRSNQVFFLSN